MIIFSRNHWLMTLKSFESLPECHLLHTFCDTLQLEKHTFEKLGNKT